MGVYADDPSGTPRTTLRLQLLVQLTAEFAKLTGQELATKKCKVSASTKVGLKELQNIIKIDGKPSEVLEVLELLGVDFKLHNPSDPDDSTTAKLGKAET